MHSWNEYPLEPVWINFQEKYLSSTIQQLPWKIKQINWETSSEPSWESFFWEKLRFSIEMQHYHPKWKANIQVSFIQELIWNTAVAFSNSLASFQFLPGCFFFFQAPWISPTLAEEWLKWISSSWRQSSSSASAQTNSLHHPFYCYTEDLFASFSWVILTKCNLRSLSEPSYCPVMVPSFFPDVVFLICVYCYSILTSCLLFYHHYFHSNLVWNCLHSLHLASQAIQTPGGLLFPP